MKRFDTEKELRAYLKNTNEYYYRVWSIRLNDPRISSKDATKSDIENYVVSEINKQHKDEDVYYCVRIDELTKGVYDLYIYHTKALYGTFSALETLYTDKKYYGVDYITWGNHKKSLGKKMEIHHDGFGNELNVGDTFVDMKIGMISKVESMTNQKIFYKFDDGYETTVSKSNALLLKSVKGIVPHWNN